MLDDANDLVIEGQFLLIVTRIETGCDPMICRFLMISFGVKNLKVS